MIAIVEVGGKQYKVSPSSQVQVDLLDAAEGSEISLDKVLLKSDEDGSKCQIGQPYTGDTLTAKVIEHVKGDKVRVFKFKPKTRYAKTRGHRQNYTVLEIGAF